MKLKGINNCIRLSCLPVISIRLLSTYSILGKELMSKFPDILLADHTIFALPVQPPMLYIKIRVFKFSLRFRVAALEIWCTTFRKFEKTCFKSLLSLHWCLILYGSVDYKTTKSKLLLNVLGVLKKSFIINIIDDFWLAFFSTIKK